MSQKKKLDKADIDRLKTSASIVKLFSDDGHTVERQGANFVTCCPWHDEKTPSCTLYEDDQTYHCFGCGAHGDALNYLKDHPNRGLEFNEAIEYLANEAGESLNDSKPEKKAKTTHEPVTPIPDEALRVWTGRARVGKDAGFKEPSAVYDYNDEQGRLVGRVARYDYISSTTGTPKKAYYPWKWARSSADGSTSWRQGRWFSRGNAQAHPWNIEDSAKRPGTLHLVVEGEKAATFARDLLPGLVVVTWHGGTEGIKTTDWSRLTAKNFILWPDCDRPDDKAPAGKGQQAMIWLAKELKEKNGAKVRTIDLAQLRDKVGHDLEHGYDIADIPSDWDNLDIEELIDGAIENQTPNAAPPRGDDGDDGNPPELPECNPDDDPNEILIRCAMQAHTDQGNANRLWLRYRHMVRYSWATQVWYVFNGKNWEPDRAGLLGRLAMHAMALIDREKDTPNPPHEVKDIAQHCKSSQGRQRRQAALADLAELDGITVTTEDGFDANSDILITGNGTLDLTTGQLADFNRRDLCTRATDTNYIPGAFKGTSPGAVALRKLLLSSCKDDNELLNYLQVALGYSLFGHNREEQFFVVYGPTRTGKTTLLQAVKNALGNSYSTTAQFTSFMLGRKSEIRSDLARLAGPRMVTAEESGKGQRLDDAIIKQASGGSPIVCRFLNANEFEYLPRFTLWLATNHRPVVNGDDDAIWERLRLIPFLHTVAPEDRDPDLKRILTETDSGREAVLSWLVEGAQRYADDRDSLRRLPIAVTAGMQQYRDDMDPAKEWINTLKRDPDAFIRFTELRADYAAWCNESGIEPLSDNALGRRLNDEGFTKKRKKVYDETKEKSVAAVIYEGVTVEDDDGLPVTGYRLPSAPTHGARARAHPQKTLHVKSIEENGNPVTGNQPEADANTLLDRNDDIDDLGGF